MLEVGIVEHAGNHYAAYGATCDGKHLSCYMHHRVGCVELRNWSGECFAELRSVFGRSLRLRFGDEMDVIALRCGRGRWIVGGSLGNSMLFRGETLLGDYDESEALHIAEQVAEHIAELDDEDEYDPQEEVDLDDWNNEC